MEPILDNKIIDNGDEYTQKLSTIPSTTPNNIQPIQSNALDRKKGSNPTPSSIYIQDNRKIRATTGKEMDPNRDYKYGTYPTATAIDIIRMSKKRGEDPWTPLAISYVESGMGKTTPENPGHIFHGQEHPDKAESSTDDMVYTIGQKRDMAINLGYNDELHQIQAYNGLGKINANGSDSPQNSYYGVPIPPGGNIDFKKTPLYGKEVIDVRDNILKKSNDIRNMVDTTNLNSAPVYMNQHGTYINSQPKNDKSEGLASWFNNRNKTKQIQKVSPLDNTNMLNW